MSIYLNNSKKHVAVHVYRAPLQIHSSNVEHTLLIGYCFICYCSTLQQQQNQLQFSHMFCKKWSLNFLSLSKFSITTIPSSVFFHPAFASVLLLSFQSPPAVRRALPPTFLPSSRDPQLTSIAPESPPHIHQFTSTAPHPIPPNHLPTYTATQSLPHFYRPKITPRVRRAVN